jgi:hypothetical protein
MTGTTCLPDGFAALEPLVERWALAGSAARAALRGASTATERAAFYEAAHGDLSRALDYLDEKGFAAFDEADERLMNLTLTLAHVSLAVELQKDAEDRHARDRAFMHITRTPAGA